VRTCRCNFCPDHESRGAPHLARFSRDVRYRGPRLAVPGEPKNVDRQPWYPTSREKRARCGAPLDSWSGQKLHRWVLTQTLKTRPFGMNCFSAGLKSSSPLLKQGAPTKLGVQRSVASFPGSHADSLALAFSTPAPKRVITVKQSPADQLLRRVGTTNVNEM
jgi:hypothetical protein